MSERSDAVVIGAGLGGLAAAVVLAGEGRKVLVLEQGERAGGYASGFQRGPYRFDTALHALNGLAPGGGNDHMYRALGIADRLRLHRLDPLYQVPTPLGVFTAHADVFRYERELIRFCPGSREGIRAYLDETLAVYRDLRRMEEDQTDGDVAQPAEMAARYPAVARVQGETWAQMMARHVTDPIALSLLPALWGYVGMPPARCDALVGAVLSCSYHEHGGWYPEGGAQAISAALVAELRERGGEIRYGEPVAGLEMSADRVTAVRTAGGQRIEADVVVSNASVPWTMLELVGRNRLPADYVSAFESRPPGYSTFAVYLGLDRDVFAEQGLAHELFVPQAPDAAGPLDWGRAGLSITDYTRVDPGCSPPGHAVVVLTAGASWDYEDTWGTGGDLAGYQQNPRYLALKDRVADALVARADEVLPGLAGAIRFREASTPLTNARYTRNPGGAIEGYPNSPEFSGAGWLPAETPVPNLFLAGAWTNTGGMNPAMASGVAAAQAALRLARPVPAGA
ncbi:MAG: phytoene desaturase family protein [Trebonia sp.]